jgi:hypothetical protein
MLACFRRERRPILFSGFAACLLAGCTSGDPTPGPTATALGGGRLPTGVTLTGLGRGDLEGVMGEPDLVREEGSAQYWRYAIADCQLDLFLFADQATQPPRVAYLRAGVPVAPPVTRRGPAVTEPL